MFSRHIATHQGSGFQKPRRENFLTRSRRWLNSQAGCLWPFARRSSKSSTQETGQELIHGVLYSTAPQQRRVPHTTNRVQHRLRGENPSTAKREETRKVWSTQGGSIDKLVEHLVPAFLEGDTTYIHSFLWSHRAFATTLQVLDSLCQRYGCILPYSSEDSGPLDQVKNTSSRERSSTSSHSGDHYSSEPHIQIQRRSRLQPQVAFIFKTWNNHSHPLSNWPQLLSSSTTEFLPLP
ncbi:ral guanine nucleotide dissociation stimulator-like [Diceros bicornis minor]|uniref:ral guanine nucleotide dissociation stimulator-like n=1 Tax=Diceros bicornis minor TaxID=77932 RepID=UPI0026EF56EE|nr:ral guanine nucleotide dissociation stimulator-like [Diceros bicornis minor]